jgi:hypothetical protein
MSLLDLADAAITLMPVALGLVAVSLFTLHLRHAR